MCPAGGAKVIVTGDKALLKISGFSGINILTPREFVELHLRA
jgi:predicted nucleic acid-binding protein